MTNTIEYGWPDGGDHEIMLTSASATAPSWRKSSTTVSPSTRSRCRRPTSTSDLESRPIGGLGVHFVKTLMDEVAYRRDGDRNVLTMRKRFARRATRGMTIVARTGPAQPGGLSASGRTRGRTAMIESEKTRGKVLVLKPVGRLDSNTINAAETDMFSYLEKGETRVVLDLSQLDYISSSGLRLVLMMGKRLSLKGGKLALCGLKPQIREVFEISGFISIVTVVGTRAEAEAAVSAASATRRHHSAASR